MPGVRESVRRSRSAGLTVGRIQLQPLLLRAQGSRGLRLHASPGMATTRTYRHRDLHGVRLDVCRDAGLAKVTRRARLSASVSGKSVTSSSSISRGSNSWAGLGDAPMHHHEVASRRSGGSPGAAPSECSSLPVFSEGRSLGGLSGSPAQTSLNG